MSLSPLHRAWRLLPAGLRREALARGAALLAPRPDVVPPARSDGVAIGGEIGRSSGLGQAARLIQAGIQHLGLPATSFEAGPLAPRNVAIPPAGHALLLVVNAPVLPAALLRMPKHMLRGRRVIANWYWELPTVPASWQAAAKCVHEIWVSSEFTRASLEPLAPGRIRVVHLPVAIAPPTPSPRTRLDFGLPSDQFIVLTSFSLASSFARKNPLGAIAAFRRAFADQPDALLLLKLSHVEDYPEDLARIHAALAGAANIRVITETLPQPDLYALIACADAVLSLHRSEGFGLVPAEAMALGKPVLATNWSGNVDFMDASCAMPIPYRLIPAQDPRGVFEAPGAVWADADIEAASVALRQLAADPSLRARLGHAAQETVRTKLGTQTLAAALRANGLEAP